MAVYEDPSPQRYGLFVCFEIKPNLFDCDLSENSFCAPDIESLCIEMACLMEVLVGPTMR